MDIKLSPYNSPLRRGFTLVEILLVVAIIGILAAIVILAVNPSRQLAQARNAQRSVDVNTILNAVYQYAIDHNGTISPEITTSPQEICLTGTSIASSSCGVSSSADLEVLTNNETYIVKIPVDPSGATSSVATGTAYQIYKSVNGRVTVRAPGAEVNATISVTR